MTNITTSSFYPINTTTTPDRNFSVNQTVNIVSAVIFSLISVLGVLGNGLVIWVTGFKMKKTVNTVWYLNLAVADFIFTAFLPLLVGSLSLRSHWPFGMIMCKLSFFLLFLNSFVSVYILVMISVDRCVCVMWPVWAQNHRSVRKASCVSLCVWVVAMCVNAPIYFIMGTRQVPEDIIICIDSLSDFQTGSYNHFRNEVIVIIGFLIGFVIPFTVIVSCYAVIIHCLRRNRTLASQSSYSFKMIAAIIIIFFLCWAPAHIMDLIKLETFTADSQMQPLGQRIISGFLLTRCLAALNSCMNPLLYVFIRRDFKAQVRKSLLKVLESAFQEEDKHSPTEYHTRQIEL